MNQIYPMYSMRMKKSENMTLNVSLGVYQSDLYDIQGCYLGYRDYLYCSWSPDYRTVSNYISLVANAYHYTYNNSIAYLSFSTVLPSKYFMIPNTEFTINFVLQCMPYYILLFSIIVIYRIISDDQSGRRLMLYSHNVTTFSYVTSIYVFYTVLMLLICLLCAIVVYFCKVVAIDYYWDLTICFLIAAIQSSACFIFCAVLINNKFVSVVFCLAANYILSSVCDRDLISQQSPYLSLSPTYYILSSMMYYFFPGGASVVERNSKIALVSALGYFVIGCIIFFLRYNFAVLVDAKHNRHLYKTMSKRATKTETEGMNVKDEDVTEEEAIVERDFNACNPDNNNGYSLLIHNVSKYFPKEKTYKRVFDHVSLSIRDNEVFGLLGPNGAGKTTLINILSTNMSANDGEFKVYGYSGNKKRMIRRLIGVVPQFDVFFDELTVGEHLQLICALHGVRWGERKLFCKEVAAIVGLEHDAYGQRAGVLSGGQKRRATLGMAMAGRPYIVYLDEPTTGLDPESRRDIWDAIRKMQEKTTVLLTTHSMEEADALCSRIAILTSDGLQCVGSQVHLKNKYGKGFLLAVALDSSIENGVDYVKRSIDENVEFIGMNYDMMTFSMDKKKVDISKILVAIQKMHENGVVLKWSVYQSSLNDVFFKLCEKHER